MSIVDKLKVSLILMMLTFSSTMDAGDAQTYGTDHIPYWEVKWDASSRLAGGSGEYMPFWSRTGQDGILPVRSSGLLTAGTDIFYKNPNGLCFEAGANLVGALSLKSPLNPAPVYGFVDRLYVSGGWKMLHLDVGMKPRQRELSDLSISGGNIIYSRNARNIPGINAWSDWIYFEKGHWFGVKGNISHYQYIDNRFVKSAYLHNKSLSAKIALGKKVDLIGSLEHWAQWGGDSPLYGQQPTTFKDYMRVFMAQHGGDGASESDRINVLGNHLGREMVRLNWKHHLFTLSFQYDKPFEDGSGVRFQNAPDGIWSVQCSFKDKTAFVTDVILEYINTTWQSGPAHDRPATKEEMEKQDPTDPHYGKIILRGCDSYFSNSEYMSGWTNHGRVFGLPMILPAAPREDDGVVLAFVSTRVRAVHTGLKGNIVQGLPYAFKGTFSLNYGNYNGQTSQLFETRPWQLSLAFNLGLKRLMNQLPIDLRVGLYADMGQLYQNSAGLTLTLSYSDFHRF